MAQKMITFEDDGGNQAELPTLFRARELEDEDRARERAEHASSIGEGFAVEGGITYQRCGGGRRVIRRTGGRE